MMFSFSYWHLNTRSLEERKLQWLKEEEERKRNAPDPTAPAGHSLMSDSERQETLQSLKESTSLLFISYSLLFMIAFTVLKVIHVQYTQWL